MADVRVRNLEEWVVDALRRRARRKGTSLEGELREVLRQEALRRKQEIGEELRRMQEDLRDKYGLMSDSAAGIREDRDARG